MNVPCANLLGISGGMNAPSRRNSPLGRPETAVDSDTPGGRLRALRKGAKMDQEALSQVLGVERPQISKYETGSNAMPDYVIERASQHFGVTAAFIRYGDTDARMARVIGLVGAGGHVEAIEQPPFRYLEVPASWHDAVALQVDGTSCWPLYDDGDDIVIRGPRRLVDDEILGRVCVVETQDGLGLVKRVRRGTGHGLFTLESPNAPTIEDVSLASARPVKMHIPR